MSSSHISGINWRGSIALIATAAAMTMAMATPASAQREARTFTERDRAQWKMIASAFLSPDGRWLAYMLVPSSMNGRVTGEASVVIQKIGGRESRFGVGTLAVGAGQLAMSESGQWIAFQRLLPNGQDMATTLFDTGAQKTIDFAGTKSFLFAGASDEFVLLENRPTLPGGTVTLQVKPLGAGELRLFSNVQQFALNSQRTLLAIVNDTGVHVWNFAMETLHTLEASIQADRISTLTWSPGGRSLAFLRADTTNKEEEAAPRARHHSIVAFTDIGAPSAKTYVTDTNTAGFPREYVVSTRAVRDSLIPSRLPLAWREGDSGIFFGIEPETAVASMSRGDVRLGENLRLWHWGDKLVPAQRDLERINGHYLSQLSIVHFPENRVVRLADEILPRVVPQAVGNFALGFDISRDPFQLPIGSVEGAQLRDYFLVDLFTGSRRRLTSGLATTSSLHFQPQLSPDGAYAIFADNGGNVVSYHIESETSRNLTAHLPTRFFFPIGIRANEIVHRPSLVSSVRVIQGWARDFKYLLLSDQRDIWRVPLDGSPAQNLTVNGQSGGIVYNRIVLRTLALHVVPTGEEMLVPDNNSIFVRTYDALSGIEGLARIQCDSPKVTYLRREENAQYTTQYYAATNADRFLVARTNATTFPDYYLADSNWRATIRLTYSNPQQAAFRWFSGEQRLTYSSASNETLHGTLYLPAGYRPGRRYPTIVEVYDRWGFRYFIDPSDQIFDWLQRGYAVLRPDISIIGDQAGDSALECVNRAVDAAIATGVVDGDRLGLIGFSYGGYETNYIVGHTSRFRAAISEGGMANLWSYAGQISNFQPGGSIAQLSQPYLSGPWWTNWESYIRNSPLFAASQIATPLLLIHGDQDESIPFEQAVELFLSLHEMGKPAVLLQYTGEGHGGYALEVERDIHQRKTQFFDYYLRDAPVPTWWEEGRSH